MRPSIMVNKLDSDKVVELIKSRRESDEHIEAEPFVVVNTPKGLATICSEGVGWWKNDDGKYLVGFYVGYSNPSYYMTEDELLSCLSSEQVDLADFIRSFGARLENNFDLWYDQVKDTPQNVLAPQYN